MLASDGFLLKCGQRVVTKVVSRVITEDDHYTGEWSSFVLEELLCSIELTFNVRGVVVENLQRQTLTRGLFASRRSSSSVKLSWICRKTNVCGDIPRLEASLPR
jgi:hypothetical protein